MQHRTIHSLPRIAGQLTALRRLERIEQAGRLGHLTANEMRSLRGLARRLRDDLPPTVLACHEKLKHTEQELASTPDLFALAVILAAAAQSQHEARRSRKLGDATRVIKPRRTS
jgi:hypothetical protein